MKHLFVKWHTLGDALLDALLDVVRRSGMAAFRPRASSARVLSLGDVPFILFSLACLLGVSNKLNSGRKECNIAHMVRKECDTHILRCAHIAHCTK
jgi:hypothetical protein